MQRAIHRLAVTCLIASLAVLLIMAAPSQTIWGESPGEAKATGSLIVDIKPIAAMRDGARWRVDGGRWQRSGSTVSGLRVGQHTVTFKSIAGWNTPIQKKTSITAGLTTTITGKYAIGPTAAFSATPRSGPTPLEVQFTDESIPGTSPITSWAWDFENDGVVDSTEQNPAQTFQDVGLYDVKLAVVSASGSNSLTKDDYIGISQTIMLPGNVPLEMVWIPAGSFKMGRTINRRTGEYEQGSEADESPRHQVTFANGFWMGKYEVTRAQWKAVMGSNITNYLDRPMTTSWDRVQTFISALNALGEVTFHLPTEAQWEYACRAGTTTRFYWGNDSNYTQIGTYAAFNSAYYGIGSYPVGMKLPNAWGLYDVSGNVWEWCEDWYHYDYTGAPTDGSAWVSPTGQYRVLRNGGWADSDGAGCRSANRRASSPSFGGSASGFRLARRSVPVAAFSATPTSGLPPLDVQFTDESLPGSSSLTSWEWDFENDGVVDSTEQHPAHTYSSVGDYDVTLTVSSSSGSDALTQQALIDVLPVVGPTAAFSADPTNGLAPLLVQFSDESTPGTSPITSWAWDFENDGVVDSTEQNPLATFQDMGLYDVKLTVGSAAGPDSLTKNDYINATSSIMLPGDVPLELVWIPAGSFMMGRYEDEQDSLDIEDPQHQVTFANGFWIGKYEVTQAQWVAVMGSNPSHFTGDLSRPVDKVSWDTIQTFIGAVNALGQGTVYLPSEAQWEYACRGGTATRFYWGDDLSYTDLGTYAWHTGNSGSTTQPVGQNTPNALGLYDMSGNLWEWCEDWYHSSYTGAPTDGSAWVSPTGSNRVIRGGSWDSTGVNHRSAFRSYSTPLSAFNDIGFRLAR